MNENRSQSSLRSGSETRFVLDIPFRTFLKTALAAALIFAVIRLAPSLMLVALSLLIATTLHPFKSWLESKGLPPWAAFTTIAMGTLGLFAGFLFFILPQIAEQIGALPQLFGKVKNDLMAQITNESVRGRLESFWKHPEAVLGDVSKHFMTATALVVGSLFSTGLVLVLSLYLLADGPRAYRWFAAFFADERRAKLDQTAREMSKIVSAYVTGQFITSALVAVFVFGLLTVLKTPTALTVAVVAAIFDVLPMIGFILALGVAALMALSVSGSVALIVSVAFFAYHMLENYFIAPKVYGNRMRLSGLVVLVSLMVAVELGGVIGGIVALPLIASYPVIERIWLKKWLGEKTLREHRMKSVG